MFPRLKEFIACTRGNIAFMTAGALVPMLTLVAGGLELAQYNKTQSSMQFAADLSCHGGDNRSAVALEQADQARPSFF